MLARLKLILRTIRDAAAWRSGHASFLLRQIYHRAANARRGFSDHEHLAAAASWLAHAQDVTGDGGICGRYRLGRGWSSSYPETTGYIVPSLLALASVLGDQSYRQRAGRCIEFLLPLQLESGAFPGMEIADNRSEPSPFNTAQIINGLVAWHRETGDKVALEAARRAGDWLLSVQDDDGAFRRHYYMDVAATYSAHASCWLAELGEHTGDARYLRSAERHLDWVLRHVDPETGWIDFSGFDSDDFEQRRGVTHTIAYTLWGILFSAEILGREDAIAVVRRAAEAIARRSELAGRLPGELNHRWQSAADYVCLTGNAQMALIWMRLHGRENCPRFLSAAFKAIDHVKACQSMDSINPALRGGIAGSDPVWGGYIHLAIPNWPAKFFVDALLAKRQALAELADKRAESWTVKAWPVSTALPEPVHSRAPRIKTVMLCGPGAKRARRMLRVWRNWGFRPDALLIETGPQVPALTRLGRRIRNDGLVPLLHKVFPAAGPFAESASTAFAASEVAEEADFADGIMTLQVDRLDSPAGLERLRKLAPDLVIHAGAGILRPPVLEIPRLGTLNAHMGLLPGFRGMNVAEWAALQGDSVGCTVHLVDSGIDTGPILAERVVDLDGIDSIAALRERVDTAQLELLGEVLKWVLASGDLPPRQEQRVEQGRQFFSMHQDLAAWLDWQLRSANHQA